jgi:hypothetical protein
VDVDYYVKTDSRTYRGLEGEESEAGAIRTDPSRIRLTHRFGARTILKRFGSPRRGEERPRQRARVRNLLLVTILRSGDSSCNLVS